MEKYSGLVQQLLLTAIIGVVSIGVGFIGELSKNVQAMSATIRELSAQIGHSQQVLSDHEARLRVVERKR